MREGLLLCQSTKGVVALRMPGGELEWQADGVKVFAVGDDHWFSRSGEQLPVARDLDTGADISAPDLLGESVSAELEFTADGEGGVMAADERPVGPGGAIQRRHLTFSSRRTRPGVRLINDRLRSGVEGSSMKLALAEQTAFAVEVVASTLPAVIPGFSALEIDGAPVRLPGDGAWTEIPFQLDPIPLDQPLPDPRQTVAFQVTSAEAPFSFQAWEDFPLADDLPVAPRHRLEWVQEWPFWNPITGIRASGGRLLAWTGGDVDPGPGRSDGVYVVDPERGTVVARIDDPVPETGKRFATNAILQDGRLVVVSRFKKGGGAIDIFDLTSRRKIKSLRQRGTNPSFGETLASDATYFAVGSPGIAAGKPNASEVEVYRWSDFKRVLRKTARGNARLGEDVALRDGILHVTTASRAAVASFALPQGKPVVTPFPAPQGAALKGDGHHVLLAGEDLRAFQADGGKSWSLPNPLRGTGDPTRVSVSEGRVVLHDDTTVSVLDESDGSLLARVSVPYPWSSETRAITAAAVTGDKLFTLQDGFLRITRLEDAGDFQAWRHFRGTGETPEEFAAYVNSRANPDAPFARLNSSAGGIEVESIQTPPPDVLVLVEMEVRSGVWRAMAWREGLGPWTTAAGPHIGDVVTVPRPHGTDESSDVRVRYAPLAPQGGLPEESVFIPWLDLPWGSANSGFVEPMDADGDGIPVAIELKLGTDPSGWDASPLQLQSVDGVVRVSHLRPRGETGLVLESSEDLAEWMPAAQDESLTIEVTDAGDRFERVTAIPSSNKHRKYFRLAIAP